MKLLSIKAHGFKSFADKIEINVGDGITGIVGPNGSGKSNVVDAIKWVLGESSLKEIRGGEKASDCIFAGSTSRSPLTRAWVSLTFDNSDHYLASDLAEIEIKREVFKTGENEYYINNTKVRKKDITDLFLDSGANADSFSIISQGKIVEIIKGRPIDRRVVIEEAAGVLKYKKRKEETMRKLDNTNDNLEKVTLVIDELESSVEPLRIQAETATKFLNFKEELKGVEVALIASDIKRINDDYENTKTSIDSLSEKLSSMSNDSSVEDSKIETLKTQSIKIDEDISSDTEELIKINQKLSELEMEKHVASERRKYEVENQKLENNILILKENEATIKKNINVITSNIKERELELEDKKRIVQEIEEEHRLTNLKKSTLSSELSNKIKEEASIKNRIEVLNDSIENDSKIPYAVKSVLSNPRLKGIHDVLIKLIDTDEKYVTAIETALGGNSSVIICDDEASAKGAIEYLSTNKLGRATFFPISVIKPRGIDEDTLKICEATVGFVGVAADLITYNPLYKSIMENQLGNVIIVNNIDTMNKLGKNIGYRYRIITLDGELLHTGGAITGGINKSSKGVMNDRFLLDKLNKDLSIITNEIKLMEEHINSIDQDLSILEDKVISSKTDEARIASILHQMKIEEAELNKKLDDNQKELRGTSSVKNHSTDDYLDKILSDIVDVSSKKEILESKINKLKVKKNDVTNEINELESISRKNNQEYNKLQNEIMEKKISIGKMDVKLDGLLNRLNEDYQITYDAAKDNYILDIDENTARTKVNYLKREIRDLGDVNVGSIAEFERVNSRYTFLREQKADLEGAIHNLMEIITDLDETMKKRFMDTFELVNQEFGSVFKKLFRGGSASLVLTEPDDILNTGVDIKAEPPGKSLKNVATLSGGEMTLTAIALLFSILNIRVVPFCVLDEVEAALDEANVDQFGTYIKEYEKASQFIVITHKKRTMEYANTLYGITMQESGVSKLVSVRLENIEE